MIKKVRINKKMVAKDFLKFLTTTERKRIQSLAEKLKGKRVVHFNATPVGGGVVEILKSLIPYLRSVGVDAHWYSLDTRSIDDSFFVVTDKLRDALQGKSIRLTPKEWRLYFRMNEKFAQELDRIECDLLIVHDWQVLPSALEMDRQKTKVYESHPDTSSPFREAWLRIAPMILKYDLVVFSNDDFINSDIKNSGKARIMFQAIDPLAPKQRIVPKNEARRYLKKFGIPEKAPLVVQVSRFDRQKNPEGVINAFCRIQSQHPDSYLLLVGLEEAKDNPESENVYREIKNLIEDKERILLFFNPEKHKIRNISEFTMYVQNGADIIVQNSVKEGFGLTLTEAMWKKKPVIGGPASGIRKQIRQGWNGYIAESEKELSKYMSDLLRDPKKRKRFGENGRAYVIKHFLFPRLALDHVKLYVDVLKNSKR